MRGKTDGAQNDPLVDLPQIDLSLFQGCAEEETWGTQLTNGTKAQPCRLAEVETLSHGCDGMEAVIGCRLMFRRFRYRSPLGRVKSSTGFYCRQEPERLFCARLFFRGIASLNGPLYDLFVQSRREPEIVLGRRCCMRRRSPVPHSL